MRFSNFGRLPLMIVAFIQFLKLFLQIFDSVCLLQNEQSEFLGNI